MRVLIADDEPLALELLRNGLKDIEGIDVVGVASEGRQALDMAHALAPDLILLDIQMPGASGIEVARGLAGTGIEVVFVTAFSDCATSAFALDAVDYLLKPVAADRLAEAIVRARRRQQAQALREELETLRTERAGERSAQAGAIPFVTELWVRHRKGHKRVPVSDIQRIEADRDYALLHTPISTFILRVTMQELEQRLDPRDLMRVHRSAFVRPDAVVELESHRRTSMKLHLGDGAIVEVGASYAESVLETLGLAVLQAQED